MSTTSPTQSRQALKRAQEVKQRRYRFRCELRSLPYTEAKALLAAAIASPPDWLGRVDIDEMLGWLPQVGNVTVERWLKLAGIHERRTLVAHEARRRRELAPRQRKAICELLLNGRISSSTGEGTW